MVVGGLERHTPPPDATGPGLFLCTEIRRSLNASTIGFLPRAGQRLDHQDEVSPFVSWTEHDPAVLQKTWQSRSLLPSSALGK